MNMEVSKDNSACTEVYVVACVLGIGMGEAFNVSHFNNTCLVSVFYKYVVILRLNNKESMKL